jgi:TRAP-type transport system periplasmic protein
MAATFRRKHAQAMRAGRLSPPVRNHSHHAHRPVRTPVPAQMTPSPKSLVRRTLTAVLVVLVSSGVFAQSKQTLRISTPAAPEDWHVKMLSVFKDSLEKSAPGRFDVQIHHSGTLFKQGAEAVAMQRGNLEMALVSMQDVAKQVPELSLFTAGYLIRDPQHLARVYNGPIGDEISAKTDEKMGIHLLQAVYYGTRQLGLRAPRNVKTPADLAGLKLRMPGSKEWLFLGQSLGAQATPLAFPEVYMALKTGTIDAQDNPLPTLKAAKFSEVTKQIVLTAHLVDVLQIAVSGKVWKALPEADRAKLKAAAREAAKYNDENRLREEKELLDAFRKQGIQVTTPDVEAFRKTVFDAYRKSDAAASWPKGLFERVVAVK